MTKTICFYGASVTTQKNGYAVKFKEYIDNTYNIIIDSRAGNTLGGSGVCCINKVKSYNPDFLFIDWFSPTFIYKKDELYILLDAILFNIQCKICFLLFDFIPLNEERIEYYNHIINYAELNNIYYIKLYDNSNKEELLRDMVHTTDKGSEFYARSIYDYFTNIILKTDKIHIQPQSNEYCNIKCLDIDLIVYHNLIIKGAYTLIGLDRMSGRNSGIIELYIDSTLYKKINTWDIYCHFKMDRILSINSEIKSDIMIKVLQDNFDSTKCRSPTPINYTIYTKIFEIKRIYYIGNITQIISDNLIIFTENNERRKNLSYRLRS
jgi:hypothetical protein